MAQIIRSISQLESSMDKIVAFAVDKMADKVKKVIQEYVTKYYKEYTPELYQRTWTFLNSVTRTDVVRTGNGWQAIVYVDTAIGYYNGWTVLGTAEAADRGWHGWPPHLGMSGGICFWEEAKAIILSPEFKSMFAGFLKSKGLNVM